MLDHERLKSVARISLQSSSKNERLSARKLLAKHGVTAQGILNAEPINHDNNKKKPVDINQVSQKLYNEMFEELFKFSRNLVEGIEPIRMIFRDFFK